MPFVTEALWGALPRAADGPGAAHRRALAVGARAPRTTATRARRRPGVELVRARPQRPGDGAACRPPHGWRSTSSSRRRSGATFDALAPGDRAARAGRGRSPARPTGRHSTRAARARSASWPASSRRASIAAAEREPPRDRAPDREGARRRPRRPWRPPVPASPTRLPRRAPGARSSTGARAREAELAERVERLRATRSRAGADADAHAAHVRRPDWWRTRRHLPGLSPELRGQQRRRDRRPAGDHRAPRPPERRHAASLGVDAIWLSPIYPSPDFDFGYDVVGLRRGRPAVRHARGLRAPSSRRATNAGSG